MLRIWLQRLRGRGNSVDRRPRRISTGRPDGRRFGAAIASLESRQLLASGFSEFVDPNPSFQNGFGDSVVALSTGNVVVTSPGDDAGGTNAGAVYLFNGATGELLSTLVGGSAEDRIGLQGVTALANGNFVVRSSLWNNAGNGAVDAGAVTFGNGATGVSGTVSSANSLVGTHDNDDIGGGGITALANGNYVVNTPDWDRGAAEDAGAVTFGNGTTGVQGNVSAANSLVGTVDDDAAGSAGVTALANGNYVVVSPLWDGAAINVGGVTFGSGATGVKGAISAANSLVGSIAQDNVGIGGVTPLTNGNYVVASWNCDIGGFVDAGAATFGDGAAGISGAVTAANSLVGGFTGDAVSFGGVTALTNGNYVVCSPNWAAAGLTLPEAGAATWGNGLTGILGVVSAGNSLVGTGGFNYVGHDGAVALTNGNYVVVSTRWESDSGSDFGAATFGNGAAGITGVVSAANSLVGDTNSDSVGKFGVTPLPNGNYVVISPDWNNDGAVNAGAVTFGDGVSGISGAVTDANSLVGTHNDDMVGFTTGPDGFSPAAGVQPLSNGNYVVVSPLWNGAEGAVADAGAATFGDGDAGVIGDVGPGNSLVGSTANDRVGNGGVTALTNGHYVVSSPNWTNGGVSRAGAATFGSGSTGIVGAVSAANSLVGSATEDRVSRGGVTALANGNFVVSSPNWDNGGLNDAGAATFGDGSTGTNGAVSDVNSLAGSKASELVGSLGVTALVGGNYVVATPNWGNGPLSGAGAVTFGDGVLGTSGPITQVNSALGESGNTNLKTVVVDDVNGTYLGRFTTETSDSRGGVIRVGSQENGFPVPPVLSNLGGDIAWVEGAAPVAIAPTGKVTDANNTHFGGGALTASLTAGAHLGDRLRIHTVGTGGGQIHVSGNQVFIGNVLLGTFAGGAGTNPLVVSLTGDATPGRVQALLRNITFENVSQKPSTQVRTVSFVLDDGEAGISDPATKQISVTAVNDRPEITVFGGNLDYTENGAPLPISTTAKVKDPDSANFAGGKLNVRFSAGGAASDRLSIQTVGQGAGQINVSGDQVFLGSLLLGTFTEGTGTTALIVTLTGNATPGRVQTLLRNVTYRNISQTPPTNARTLRATVSDGDGKTSVAVEKQILVTALNDRPVISGFGPAIDYTAGDPSLRISTTATINDVDSANFDGGTLIAALTDNGVGSDRLEIREVGADPGQINTSGDQVFVGTILLGTFTGGTGTTPLAVSLTANATPARVQNLLRNLTYRNTQVTPSTAARTLQVTISDGDGQTSVARTKLINVSLAATAGSVTAGAATGGAATALAWGRGTLYSLPDAGAGQGLIGADVLWSSLATRRLRF